MHSAICKKYISKSALEHNIDLLTRNISSYFSVVKSNAYGHGMCDVAKMCLTFQSVKKLAGFAVGTVDEALILRKEGIGESIIVLLGAMPQRYEEEFALAKQHNLIMLVNNETCLKMAVEAKIPFGIKWDTGMNRLGFTQEDIPFLLDYLKDKKNARLDLSVSHFALPEDLEPLSLAKTRGQLEKFNMFTQGIKELFPHVKTSLGQSAYTLANEMPMSDIARLGLSMYGINPFYETKWSQRGEALKPVMSVSAPILNVRKLKAGEGIGYGFRDMAEKDRDIAVVGIGYDNGYRRLLPSKERRVQANYKGKRIELVGVVCMQVCFFDVTGLNAKEGDEVFVMGGEGQNAVTAEELTSWWNAIPYEAICDLGKTNNSEII